MIKIAHVEEAKGLKNLPKELHKVLLEVTAILDGEYGENRDADCDLGGYVLLIQSKEELKMLMQIHIDVENATPEHVGQGDRFNVPAHRIAMGHRDRFIVPVL